MRAVVGVDGVGKVGAVVGLLVAAGGQQSDCTAQDGGESWSEWREVFMENLLFPMWDAEEEARVLCEPGCLRAADLCAYM